MIVLAIDTTSQQGGVGVFRDGQPLAIIRNESPANLYSVTLFDMTERAIQKAAVPWHGIDLFAVSNGPGSFTGIRVGLAAVQGWAKAYGRPAIGISNLRAMVQTANPGAEWALPLLDARRGEFFLGRFRRRTCENETDETFSPANEDLVVKPEEIAVLSREISSSDSAGIAWLARKSDAAAAELRQSLNLHGQWIEMAGTLLPAIAQAALQELDDGGKSPLRELQPRYIRRPDAELNWRD
jgi:tRNA threonylcarbamoyladenosine biosynthesis protein TsaB